jgi:Protein of unknown function (DUF2510)
MNCPDGHANAPEARFCASCGRPVGGPIPRPSTTPAPGWYDDGQGAQRWFDGQAWTDAVAPTGGIQVGITAAGAPPSATVQPAARAGWGMGEELAPAVTPVSNRKWVPWAAAAGVAVLVAVAVAIGAGAMSAHAHQATTTLSGTFDLYDADSADSNCFGQGGYSDIGPGTPVTVTNENGTVIGTASLGHGSSSGGNDCTFTYGIDGLPSNASQYLIEVGSRGNVGYSHDQMVESGWAVSTKLGDPTSLPSYGGGDGLTCDDGSLPSDNGFGLYTCADGSLPF